MKTDARLRQDVLAELQRDASIEPARLGVRVGDGVVMLTGCLRSLSDTVAIERAVRCVQGVMAIAMDFDIGPEPQPSPPAGSA